MATIGEADIKTEYPKTEGTTFGTTKTHEIEMFLEAEESIVPSKDRAGF